MLRRFCLLLLVTIGLSSARPMPPYTFLGVHMAAIFNYNETITDGEMADECGVVDWVWGAGQLATSLTNIPSPCGTWHEYYNPYSRIRAGLVEGTPYTTAWYNATHPNWIMYLENRVTIAQHPNQPWTTQDTPFLDMTNPNVIDFMADWLAGALNGGYNGISLDNTIVRNHANYAGHYLLNGTWDQMYTGTDNAFVVNMATGLENLVIALRRRAPNVWISINQPFNLLPRWWASFPGTDMILDEIGFTDGGRSPPYTTIQLGWLQKATAYTIVGSAHNKAFTLINQLPFQITANMTSTNSTLRAYMQWALACYLLVKANYSYFWFGGKQQYGLSPSLLSQPETSTANAIGYGVGGFFASQNVYMRTYSNGLAVVNPDCCAGYFVEFTPGMYQDLYGNAVSSVTMGPSTGLVLLNA